MRDDIMLKEDLKVLFKSLKKPTGGDFAELIDFAETLIEFFAHSTTGTGTISENVNASVTINNEYGEVHMVQSYDGMYLFSELDRGTYGKGGMPVNDAQFIHIGPSPDIIDDDTPSTSNTYSSQHIEDNFLDENEAQTSYVSKIISSDIDDPDVDINSSGEIRATNIINTINYLNGYLLLSKGRVGQIQNYTLQITPDVTVRFHNIPANTNAHNIVADFNAYANTNGLKFIKGDVVILNYDLSNIDDGNGNKLGIYVYMIKKEFPFANPEVTQITSETGDLINFTPVNLHSILSNVYTKAEVDELVSAATQGITGTVATFADLSSVVSPGEGEQWIVETYTAGEGGAPVDGNTGVFQHNGGVWAYVYTLQYDHSHAYTDITGIDWLAALQSSVYVGDFGQDDQAQTVTLAEKNQMGTNTADIATNAANISANTDLANTKEADLGVPTVNDQVLTSLTDGTRAWSTPPQGVTEFIALSDTPIDYGTSGQVLKSDGSGIVWGTDDSGAGTPTWGDIEGTLSAQTDLQAALDAKASTGHNHDTTYAAIVHNHDADYEPVLGSPTTSGYILSSSIDGIRSWVPPATGGSEVIWGTITGTLTDQGDLNTALNAKEDGLGNPSTTGYVLSSDTAGVRTWIAPTTAPPASDPVPSGVICMWSTSAAVPTGWSICDGNNGTPDLTGVFIRGGNASTVGDIGGSNDSVVVTHSHTFTGDPLPEHSHTHHPDLVTHPGAGNGEWGMNNDGTYADIDVPFVIDPLSAGTPSGTIAAEGVSGTNTNIPAYYTLIYIMKD